MKYTKRISVLSAFAVLVACAFAYGDDAERREVIEIVNKAARILEEEGEAGLAKVGELRFGEANYVFVNTMDGVTLMHIQEHLIGRSLAHLRDDTGSIFLPISPRWPDRKLRNETG